jgi:hypothetical protein
MIAQPHDGDRLGEFATIAGARAKPMPGSISPNLVLVPQDWEHGQLFNRYGTVDCK